jgi:malate synthase
MAIEIESPTESALTKLKEQHSVVLNAYMLIEVKDEGTQVEGANAIANLRNIIRQVEDTRKELVKPLNDHVKFINSRFEQFLNPVKKAENYLREQISQYRAQVEEARRKEQDRQDRLAEKRAERAEERGDVRPIPEVVAPIVSGSPKTIAVSTGRLCFMKIRKWEVSNLEKVPREYFVLDESRITKVVKAGIPDISGIRIWEEEVPVARA